jgi:hypothetical protein
MSKIVRVAVLNEVDEVKKERCTFIGGDMYADKHICIIYIGDTNIINGHCYADGNGELI